MKLSAYPRTKSSGVEWLGDVPEHWKAKRLKTSATCWVSNVDKVPAEDELPVRLCNYTDVYYNDHITPDMALMETTATADEIRRFGLRVGDVVITKDSEDWSDIAVPALVKQSAPDLVCGYHLAIIRSRANVLFGDYLLRAFQSCAVNQQFQVAASGVTRYGLPKSSIGDAWIPLPDYPEQQAIAAYLDRETGRLDRLVGRKRELIERLKEKRTALISRTVTRGLPSAAARAAGLSANAPLKPSGVPWLDEVPEHWKVSKLKHIKASTPNAFVDGPFGSNLKTEHFVSDGDVFVIESGFATRGELNEENLKTIEMEHFLTIKRSTTSPGDVIIAKIGANFGLNHILPPLTKPAVVSGNSLKLTVNHESCSADYFHYQLLHLKWCGAIDLLANITAQPALSLGGMNTLSCVQPPLPEQAAIAAYLDLETAKLDALVGKVEAAVERLQEYRTALITAAVTGKIDVRTIDR